MRLVITPINQRRALATKALITPSGTAKPTRRSIRESVRKSPSNDSEVLAPDILGHHQMAKSSNLRSAGLAATIGTVGHGLSAKEKACCQWHDATDSRPGFFETRVGYFALV